ncbi:terminase large subunit [Leifsonia sp. WHRI 6310E]|uniref:terminase large subunit n=1 Tax=Leifsonia sp. WHRI 6310E TaxID=3162562 RepID=UPI0035A99388
MPAGTPSRPTARTYSAPLSPEVEWYLDERGYKLEPWQRPLWRTKEPRTVRGAYFDPARVDRVIDALSRMRHTQGKWAGHPLRPDPWQVAFIIAPIFGWVTRDAFGLVTRIIRNAWIEVPRKNGKTTIASGLGLYLTFADGEAGAQVIAAAGSKDQAMNAFRPAYLIAGNSPDFKAAGVQSMKKEIVRPVDQSFMKAVGSIGDLLQGSNPSGFIADEMHVHKDMSVIDALESGTGARDQPLGLIITTADDGGQLTPYAQRRKHVEQLCRGVIKSRSEYAVIFAAPADADPFAETTWRAANPGYGVSPTKAFMVEEAEKAKSSPANLSRFLRLNLNVRTKQETKYIDLFAWDRNHGLVSELALTGRECYGGLDLASVSDLSSLCLLFPDREGAYQALWRYWTPEDNIAALDKRTNGAASEWVKEGWLTTTPGNVQDYDFIRAQVGRDAEKFRILSIGFDPYNASQITNDLAADGMNLVKVRQGFLTLSSPTKQLQRLVLMGKPSKPMLMHGGNPVTRWCIDNLAVAIDPAENVKPDKKNSGDKIDGVSALVNALSEAMNEEIVRSAYDDHDLIIA